MTVLVGMFLYLGGALYFAASVYLKAVGDLFERAVALARHRFRVGPAFSGGYVKEMGAAPSLHEASSLGPVGRGRFHSWLN